MRSIITALLPLLLPPTFMAALSHAHFVLQSPPSLGFTDTKEGQSPCGGFDIANRSTVTDFPVAGYPFYLLTTHTQSEFEYRAALLNDTAAWLDLIPPVLQSSVGYFCLGAVSGISAWVGLDAVVQVKQSAPDGVLYQVSPGSN
ncbi:hypothetical protein GP486_008201 [Trichoglossum hirsutum]|uniref:Copper acquisition factor BIM1-like domain-containing protein n=1 Tax=Trichoglossum hirsutum TaxID=265104 RepID=A0A9P8L1Z0_9PEZI|nr:hypothetical protein GP486_008201 [Trichoglossum hirsutum]